MADSPYWAGPQACLRALNHGQHHEDVHLIKIDCAHTFAIAGYGKDWLASCLVLLACRCNIWGCHNFELQLQNAYGDFRAWCRRRGKNTTIVAFDKSELKISSPLAWCKRLSTFKLRLQQFPRGLGKGSGAAVLGGWLEETVKGIEPSSLPVSRQAIVQWTQAEVACQKLFQVVQWGLIANGAFFRTIYGGGAWLGRSEAQRAVAAGWDSLVPCQDHTRITLETLRRPTGAQPGWLGRRGGDCSTFVPKSI